ncbi:MAG: hypothetical protein ACI9G1_005784 [Pirellulaceae bacterium]|jgi:hypothetical protein
MSLPEVEKRPNAIDCDADHDGTVLKLYQGLKQQTLNSIWPKHIATRRVVAEFFGGCPTNRQLLRLHVNQNDETGYVTLQSSLPHARE